MNRIGVFLRLLWIAVGLGLWVPALAAPAALDAQVLLVVPDHSGSLPAELRPMRAALAQQGFDGARVAERRKVRLVSGRTTHVEIGAKEVDLDLLWVRADQASVRVTPGRARPAVTQVAVASARFFVTVPARRSP